MKEVTYEDWQKNPTPRMMWVWDDNEKDKVQRKVIYFHDNGLPYPIIALSDDETGTENFKYCAEIKKTRRMTNKELSRWVREKTTREYKYKKSDDYIYSFYDYIYSFYEYKECCADEEVDDILLIREDDGEWREPLVEVEE